MEAIINTLMVEMYQDLRYDDQPFDKGNALAWLNRQHALALSHMKYSSLPGKLMMHLIAIKQMIDALNHQSS